MYPKTDKKENSISLSKDKTDQRTTFVSIGVLSSFFNHLVEAVRAGRLICVLALKCLIHALCLSPSVQWLGL